MEKLKATLHMKKNSADNFVFHRTAKIKGPSWNSPHRNRTQPVGRGRKVTACLSNDFAYIDDQPESGLLQHHRLALDIHEGQRVTKPSQWAAIGAVHLSIHFAWMTNDQTCKEILIHGSGHYLAIVRDMKETCLEDPSQWHLGRSLLDSSHSMGKNIQRYLCLT